MSLAQTRLECLQILKLFQCIRQREWTQVEKLVANGVPNLINYTEPNEGEMPLSLAAVSDDLEMVEHLLRLGASPNAVDGKGRTAIMRAAQVGNHACVEMLVKRGANLKICDAEGRGVLFHCAYPTELHERCAQLAIAYGADVNNCNDRGTPILVSAAERAVELENLCMLLIDGGANPNNADQKTNRTALMAAAFAGSKKVSKALIEKGADVNCVMTGSKINAVHEAAKGGYISVLQMLSGCGANFDCQDDHRNTAMHLAAKGRHAMCCKFLAQRGCSSKVKNDHGYTARMIAKEEGSKSTVKECRRAERSSGAKTTKNDPWAISMYDFFCTRGKELKERCVELDGDETGRISKEELVEILTHSGAPVQQKLADLEKLMALYSPENDVDYKSFLSGKKFVTKAFRTSAFDKKKAKKKKRRQRRAKKGKTKIPVPICTHHDHERKENGGPPGAVVPRHVRLIDMHRLDQDPAHRKHILQDDGRWYLEPPGRTFVNLNDAVRHWDVETIQAAVGRGNEVIHWRDKYFKTPLMAAAHEGHFGLVVYLVEIGADVNATDNFKWTALHFACRQGHLEVVEHLLRNGAKVNAVTLNGGTALMRAIESGRPEVVQLVIDSGAKLRVETRKGKSPLELAASYGDPRVYDIVKAKWDSLPPPSDKRNRRTTQLTTKTKKV